MPGAVKASSFGLCGPAPGCEPTALLLFTVLRAHFGPTHISPSFKEAVLNNDTLVSSWKEKQGDAKPSEFSAANLPSLFSFNWLHRMHFPAKCLSCLIPAELAVESNTRSKGGPSK